MAKKENELQITFFGGVGSVTGANFLLETFKTRILVDCGLLQGNPEADKINREPWPYDVKSVDFLFLTHAHLDHIGRVCKIVRDGFQGVIFSTPETREIAQAMLFDAVRVMEGNSKADPTKPKPLYNLDDFNNTFKIWKTIPYHKMTKVNDEVFVYLKDAGHILGSSMYEFSVDGKKVVFTGDSGNSPTPLLKDTEKITDADYLVMDSVYGDRNHESKTERDEKFKQIIKETIQKGGTLVIPAFSIERTQVILYELNRFVENHEVPSVPVFLDSPLGIKVTEIYKRGVTDFNQEVQKEIRLGDNIFNFPKLSITHGSRESAEISLIPGPKIIIAGSGMSSGGRIVQHEINFLPDPRATVLLMGYQALGTLGRKIQERPKEIDINGKTYPVNARIEEILGYSSHKDSDNLVEMVSDTAKTVKKVFVVMGEPNSSIYLVQRLKNELGVDAVYPERAVSYPLV